MKKETTKTRLWVGECLNKGKVYVYNLVNKNPYILYQLLADATDENLWRMVTIFRSTNFWDQFLHALLLLPQDVWAQNQLVAEKAKTCFEAKEIEQIINIYERMDIDFKALAILFNLDYDKYWIHRVKKAAEKNKRTARVELRKARDGLSLGGIPTKASKKCLVKLTAYVKSLKGTRSRSP